MLEVCCIARNTHVSPFYLVYGDWSKNFRHAAAAADGIFGVHFQLLEAMLLGLLFYTRCVRKRYREITK
jgi:hypothetical protein